MDNPPTKEKIWKSLKYKGPVFPEPYQKLPNDVKFYYNGKEICLSEEAEEVAVFYAKLLGTNHTKNDTFNKNFFNDWREVMTEKERTQITDLKKCNFKQIHKYFKTLNENRTKEEKAENKKKEEEIKKEYGYCIIDGVKEQIANYKIEPPGLFIGQGEHPKNGMLKKRIMPEDVIINCSEGNIPKAPEGHTWKRVQYDQTVMWLAAWIGNIQNTKKYIILARNSTQNSKNDEKKFNMARELGQKIDEIRKEYTSNWESSEMCKKQRGTALYFIDKLALRVGNKKDEDEADTVGCCSLRVEHITLHDEKYGQNYVVEFDFRGKDSVLYNRDVPVDEVVFKNLKHFISGKKPEDDLFDQLNPQHINKHLDEFIPGLTSKVFRTYKASYTMEEQLNKHTKSNDSMKNKIQSYKDALGKVAKLCNHTSKQTSIMNYIDPRIIVAWCKKNNVPIKEIYTTKSQRDIFKWAISTESNFQFKL